MGGCDIFLPASSCELPPNWRQLLLKDQLDFERTHPPFDYGSVQDRLDYLRDRRYVLHTEYYQDSEPYELYHTDPPGWARAELFDELPRTFDAYRAMPECWWNRQLLAYHWRMRPAPAHRLLRLVAQSLQMPQPKTAATHALAYSGARAPSVNHTAYWWLAIQALKVAWQVEQAAPGFAAVISRIAAGADGTGNGSVSTQPPAGKGRGDTAPVPLLSWAFMRHGDKGQETRLFSDDVYLSQMLAASHQSNLSYWFIGTDDLHTPDRVRLALRRLPEADSIRLYTSALVDGIDDKAAVPHSTGWQSERMAELTDADRHAIVWRTMLDLAVAQVADAFLSIWSSNQPRMAYALATAVSDARATAPFIGLDMIAQHRKEGYVEGCEEGEGGQA